jgi:cell division septum initiation protein DivIVA
MTTDGDTHLPQPDESEPLEQLFADVFTLVDKTVARITDAEVDEHLRSVLNQSGHSGPPAGQPAEPGDKQARPDDMDTAARVLALAQQAADQVMAGALREADRARREADEMLTEARRQAEQITGDARARAESLDRDTQERHRQAMGSLVQTREELERRVDDLRAFEREYRSRLKAYLEGQLRDLEAGVTDSGTRPAIDPADIASRVDELRAFEREYRSRLKAYLEGQLRDLEAGVAEAGVFPAVSSAPAHSHPGAFVGRDPHADTWEHPLQGVSDHPPAEAEIEPARPRRT